MNTLRFYLWKEWREFRAVAIGLAVSLPLLLALALLALPEQIYGDNGAGRLFAGIGGVGMLLIALFALTTDLFAGEVRNNRIDFLGRLPAGLSKPFLAKSIVFLAGTAGFFLYGFYLSSWAVELKGGFGASLHELAGRTWGDGSWHWRHEFVWGVLLVLLALPVSCFVPRGVLTLPFTALLGAGFLAPLVVMMKGHPSLVFATRSAPVLLYVQAFLLVTPLIAAYLAFVRGYRAGGGWPRAMKWGIAVLLLAAITPVFPRAHAMMVERGWAQGRESLGTCYLGAGGRYLYVTRVSYISYSNVVALAPVRLDLRSGENEVMDRSPLGVLGHSFRIRQPVAHPYLRFNDGVLDTRTGELSDIDPLTATHAVARATTHMRTSDGEPIWVEGGEFLDPNGSIERDPLARYAIPMGLGMQLVRGQTVFDPYRRAIARIRQLRIRGDGIRIRPGEWLIRDQRGGGWQLLDPDRLFASDARGMEGSLVALLEDGRALMRCGAEGFLDLVDPETGITWPLQFEDDSRARADSIRNAGGFGRLGSPARDEQGRRLFEIDRRFARLDGNRLVRCAPATERYTMLIACGDGDICYALDGDRSVVELSFGSDHLHAIYSVEKIDR